ncbi:hypothetical protein LK13_09345 [Paenibacillus polymyxa]|uniref:hypothetical protein n=1 Tax=Paenibacillus polymyxa TaxID=1406 RepID=UPI00057C4D1C|nr:hypothetical protein [Paenibacillus polymyxa]AIY08775.1 hypothetical protein LK13_09345 [Paenibacillus polymyxa]
MIRFVMINKKNKRFDFYSYTNEIMNNLKNELESNGLEFYLNKETIRKATFEYKQKEFLINFTVVATSETIQLKVDITLPTKDTSNLELHDVKIKIKDLMIGEWEQCVWLEDSQSELFAEELYKKVHSVENSLRRLINSIMFFKLGGDWWDRYMPYDLINKYNQRSDQYRRRTPSFDNIHTNLMSIDTGDLIRILNYKTYKLKRNSIFREPDEMNLFEGFAEPLNALTRDEKEKLFLFQGIMNSIFFNTKSIEKLHPNLLEKLEEQMEVDKDFWEDYFLPWFSCDSRKFSGLWSEFTTDRNHVAHNKLIDLKLRNKFNKGMSELQKLITEAEKKFEKFTETEVASYLEETRFEAEVIQRQQTDDWKDYIEEATGIRILEESNIIEEFQENLTASFDNLKDMFYYRSDLEFLYNEPTLNEESIIFTIEHNVTRDDIQVIVLPDIDSSAGATSTVTLRVITNDKEEMFDLYYTNGEAEYNDEQTNYMPLVQDHWEVTSGLSKMEKFISSLISSDFPEITEDEIANVPCRHCESYTIYFSDEESDVESPSRYKTGECLNCGRINTLGFCMRCDRTLNQEEDGLCDGCEAYIDAQ